MPSIRTMIIGAVLMGHVTWSSAVETVVAPAEPPTVETWTFERLWSIHGDDPDAPLLGVPGHTVVADDGHVLILDTQMTHILDVSPEGEHVATIGRAGEGPGEVSRAAGLVMLPGDEVGLLQSGPPKIERLARDGTPLGAVSLGNEGQVYWWRVEAKGGVTVVSGQRRELKDPSSQVWSSTQFVSRVSDDGETLTTYAEASKEENFGKPTYDEAKSFFPGHYWDLCPDGNVVYAPERDRYKLEFVNPEGEVVRVIERPFEPRIRTEEDMEELEGTVHYYRGNEELEVEKSFLSTDPVIRRIEVRGDGTLWVTSCYGERDLPEGVSRRYDVFEPDGSFRGEVLIAYGFDAEDDAFSMTDDGLFLHTRNIAGAVKARYRNFAPGEVDEDEDEDEDVTLEIIRLRRAR